MKTISKHGLGGRAGLMLAVPATAQEYKADIPAA